MSACSAEWSERLSAAHDGELDAAERALLEAHVGACLDCASQREALASLGGRMRGLRAGEVSPSLERRLRARLLPRPRARALWLTPVAAAAAVLMMVARPVGLNSALAEDLERHHYKAFSQRSPCEFTSSDPHAVAAWLSKSVGYAVEVPVIPGAELLGARRCKLRGVLTASLQYRKGGQALTLFITRSGTPAAQDAARFARDAPRCTRGQLGESICAAHDASGARIAVAELDDAALLAALNAQSARR